MQFNTIKQLKYLGNLNVRFWQIFLNAFNIYIVSYYYSNPVYFGQTFSVKNMSIKKKDNNVIVGLCGICMVGTNNLFFLFTKYRNINYSVIIKFISV